MRDAAQGGLRPVPSSQRIADGKPHGPSGSSLHVIDRGYFRVLPHAAPDIVRNVTDLPWDFVVLGIPKSVQARASSIRRWKEQVRAAAWEFWPPGEAPLDHKVQIHVT